jgi:hypothetical protein
MTKLNKLRSRASRRKALNFFKFNSISKIFKKKERKTSKRYVEIQDIYFTLQKVNYQKHDLNFEAFESQFSILEALSKTSILSEFQKQLFSKTIKKFVKEVLIKAVRITLSIVKF